MPKANLGGGGGNRASLDNVTDKRYPLRDFGLSIKALAMPIESIDNGRHATPIGCMFLAMLQWSWSWSSSLAGSLAGTCQTDFPMCVQSVEWLFFFFWYSLRLY